MEHTFTYYPDVHGDYRQYKILSTIENHNEYNLLDYTFDINKFKKIFGKDYKELKATFEYTKDNIIEQVLLYKEDFAIKYHLGSVEYTEDGETDLQLNIVKQVVIYYNEKTEKLKDKVVKQLRNIINIDKETSYFYTIGINQAGYFLEKNKLNFDSINLKHNYGEGFDKKYDILKDNILNNSDGLFLLFGEPGTGKTSLIRKIIHDIQNDKKVIYVPSFMVQNLSQPEFIGFLKNYQNSILVLEDAEHVILSREDNLSNQSGVSNILNMTNGLLNDIMKVQILATFNTEKENVDKALLREGRLMFQHEFNKLSIDEAQLVLNDLNITEYKPTKEMTLAEIYNLSDYLEKDEEVVDEVRTIGFKRD